MHALIKAVAVLLLLLITVTSSDGSLRSPRRRHRSPGQLLEPKTRMQTNMFNRCNGNVRTVVTVQWGPTVVSAGTDCGGSGAHSGVGRIHVEDGKAGHKGVDLVFDSITTKDKGSYTCSANVDGEDVDKSFMLHVIKGLDFSKTEAIQYVEEGLDSTLVCQVESDPKPKNIKWYRNNNAVKKGVKYDLDPAQPGRLIVRNATMSDGGQYKCQALQLTMATSDLGSTIINVNVHHKPQWRGVGNEESQAYGFVHGEVNLTCEAEAEPSANFTWLKDQQPVQLSDTVKIINQDHKSVLQLTLSESDMFGDYTCKAENHLGTLERVIILSEGAKPLQPKAQITKVETQTLELKLIPEEIAEMPILGFKVEYKMKSEDWEDAPSVYFKKGDTYLVNGLLPDTEYNVRVSAKNAAGFSEYTHEIAKKTKPMMASQTDIMTTH
ncbi:unnamed protein product, partial [Meganyctiphanes norvegica]